MTLTLTVKEVWILAIFVSVVAPLIVATIRSYFGF